MHVADPRGDLIAVQVYTTVDAASDPGLAQRLLTSDPARALNVVRFDGAEPLRIAVPVLYHDGAAELFALVLDDAYRHRELDERIRVYERLRDDGAAIPVYVKEFAVVYGGAGLRDHLAHRGARRVRAQTTPGVAPVDDALTGQIAPVALDDEEPSAPALAPPPLDERAATARAEADGDRGGEPDADGDGHDHDAAAVAVDVDDGGASSHHVPSDEIPAGEFDHEPATGVDMPAAPRDDGDPADVPAAARELRLAMPPGSDPLTTETGELPSDIANDSWLDEVAARPSSSFGAVGNVVRLALVTGEHVARGLAGSIDVRAVLHRTPDYPVIVLVLGPPIALRTPSPTQLAPVALDVAGDDDRAVLDALARRFDLAVDVIVRGKRVRRVRLTAPLADNIGYLVAAADDHLRDLASDGEPSFARGCDRVLSAGFDLLGVSHPEASELRDDKLSHIGSAQRLRRAIAMAERFTRPSREDYLVCTRGFPLARWRELRHRVLEAAVEWGLWMGPELAQLAVDAGLARSRSDLVSRLDRGFHALRRQPAVFDLDDDAAADNLSALRDEASALGLALRRSPNGAIASDEASSVSGSIDGRAMLGTPRDRTTEQLLAELDDRRYRIFAALELCWRADPRTAEPVIAAIHKMSRSEAVRVLGMVVKFGAAAKPHLLDGLSSSKAFLRHGCSLALALLRDEEATQAVIDLLFAEPTEMWRELARALGQVGPSALLPLASTFGKLDDGATAAAAERAAWAMAHVAVRGGKAMIETVAGGHSMVAPVARRALELHALAARDQVRIRPGSEIGPAGRDVTVNRAFSRRFFEALELGMPEASQAGLGDLEASSPMELFDEAELVNDDDIEAELDESDLIQT